MFLQTLHNYISLEKDLLTYIAGIEAAATCLSFYCHFIDIYYLHKICPKNMPI